jgi:hypothetical protein
MRLSVETRLHTRIDSAQNKNLAFKYLPP